MAAGGAAASASVPVIWDFLGYRFEAGPLVVAVCATLMTRLIVTMNTGSHRWVFDTAVTALCVLVSALWVQANSLGLLPAGISGIAFGAIGIGIIGIAKSQAAVAFREAVQTFVRALGHAPPPPTKTDADPDDDLLDKLN